MGLNCDQDDFHCFLISGKSLSDDIGGCRRISEDINQYSKLSGDIIFTLEQNRIHSNRTDIFGYPGSLAIRDCRDIRAMSASFPLRSAKKKTEE